MAPPIPIKLLPTATPALAQAGTDNSSLMTPALTAAAIAALASGKTYAAPNDLTGTSYTIQASDREALIRQSNAASIADTLPNNLPEGFLCTVRQTGAGQITFVAASGATLVSFAGYTKTAGQYAIVTLEVLSNSNGTSAVWALDGMGA